MQLRGGQSRRSIEEIRAADRARKKKERQEAAAVYIPPCANPARRKRFEKDPPRWLRYYLSHVYDEPFCAHHLEMIAAIVRASTYGGDQAIAGPRGEWKTSIAEGTAINRILCGVVKFCVLFAATALFARNSLASIKQYILESERLKDDYPEIWHPISRAADRPQAAHSMWAYGQTFELTSISFQWSGDEIIFPRIPGSASAGSIIATRGLDSAIYGLKRGKLRPELAIIDDPDTDDTIRNPEQAQKIEDKIERTIAGMGPSGRRIARVMLTTVHTWNCLSARYTDPSQKPSWHGKRFPFVIQFPVALEKWAHYVNLRRIGLANGDPFAREAHRYYLAHRKEMDEGVIVSRPSSFDSRKLPDGSRLQVSAIQRYYDHVADFGEDSALSELQGTPRDDSDTVLGLRSSDVAQRLTKLARGTVGKNCQQITAYIDVHARLLYYVVSAWDSQFGGGPIDYGTYPQQPIAYFAQATAPVAMADVHPGTSQEAWLTAGLTAVVDRLLGIEYQREDGASMRIGMMLIDAKWGDTTELVKRFCRRHPSYGTRLFPAMGVGLGPTRKRLADYRPEPGARVGPFWREAPAADRCRVVTIDANAVKSFAAARLLLPPGSAGAWELFGDSPHSHTLFADHCTAEEPKTVMVKGTNHEYTVWTLRPNRDNHYWDCLCGTAVAASMLGIHRPDRIPGRGQTVGQRPTMAQLAAEARRR